MRLYELQERWLKRRDEFARVGAQVDGAKVIDEFLADVAAAANVEADETLSLRAAARESGYSPGHLARLIRDGGLTNAGRLNAPRIRRRDLPRKAARLPRRSRSDIVPTKVQIARSVVHPMRSDDG